ncbi:DnaB helicase C-terminal domain-containing protein, partial [Escherichia coli]|nr:DnaB helicase C-terminal domain-containing protein [Escherichia coli]
MANELKIPMNKFMAQNLEKWEWQKIADWTSHQQGRPLAVLDKPSSSITEIKRYIRSVHRRKPLAGVVVD